MELSIHKDLDGLSLEAARIFQRLAAEKVRSGGVFTVALSGGTTPGTLYRVLSSPPYSEGVPWDAVHLFFGDERCVGPDHPESNYRMVDEALISRVAVPPENVHRMKGELDPAGAARSYEKELMGFFEGASLVGENGMPVFDLVLLGLGGDGHTLSLFPGTKALKEAGRVVTENYVEGLKSWRITLTLPVVKSAAKVVFLVSGEAKGVVLRDLVAATPGGRAERYPARMVEPVKGSLLWLVDAAAAMLLSGEDNDEQ
jgi:6-phosphogluconolactonase